MARELQAAFLPRHFPVFPAKASPEQSACSFATATRRPRNSAATFSTSSRSPTAKAGVLICDVMGHGVRAALVTAIVRGLVEELKPIAADPGRFLTDAESQPLRDFEADGHAAFHHRLLHRRRSGRAGEVRYANAGHPAAVSCAPQPRHRRAAEPPNNRPGPALGVFEQATYPTERRPLARAAIWSCFSPTVSMRWKGRTTRFSKRSSCSPPSRAGSRTPTPQLFDELLEEVKAFAVDQGARRRHVPRRDGRLQAAQRLSAIRGSCTPTAVVAEAFARSAS